MSKAKACGRVIKNNVKNLLGALVVLFKLHVMTQARTDFGRVLCATFWVLPSLNIFIVPFKTPAEMPFAHGNERCCCIVVGCMLPMPRIVPIMMNCAMQCVKCAVIVKLDHDFLQGTNGRRYEEYFGPILVHLLDPNPICVN